MRRTQREFNALEDYSIVRRLWEGIEKGIRPGRSDTLEEIHKHVSNNPGLSLLAESGNQLLGTVITVLNGKPGFIYHLAVQEARRN